MTPLQQRMIEDMQLRGFSARTQDCYVAAVRQLAGHYHRSPDQLTEEDLRQYFLYLANEKKVARHRYHRAVRDQVLLRADVAAALDHTTLCVPAAGEETASGAES